ncbi:MAG TPA: restriction endonuclease subunit S [Archangium sp.]|uniref:restriction endonuclease subunit S n=1 Tax=Archangium sp. TaxID=1872627 RepID=UPI002E340404|nr:restriction endonuclease subunit S [Archangium sp.]HEX5749815.1 restriction endonuclease subunit S [Archangium sp.]
MNDRQQPLPPQWAWTTLGTVAEVRLGKMLSPKAYEKGLAQLPYLRNENVRWGHIDFTDVKLMGFKSDELARYQVNDGDLLVCEGGEPGRAAVFSGKSGQYMYQKALHRVRPRCDVVNTKFLQLFFQHGAGQASTSQTTIAHLPLEKMLALALPLPPRAEQERIVSEAERQFTRLDAGVAALKRVQAQLKRYRASVLKAACEGRLVPTEAELARREKRDYEPAERLLARIIKERRARWEADQFAKMKAAGKLPKDDKWKAKYIEPAVPDTAALPPLPSGWVWATLEQLAADEPNSITDGPFGSNLKSEHYVEAGPRVVRLQNIGEGRFLDEHAHISRDHFDRLKKHRVYPGDLVIAALSERPPRACSIPESLGDAIVKADCVRFKPDAALAQSRYLLATLNSETTRALLSDKVHGVGRPRLNLGEIRSIAIPLPPQQEQLRIIEEVEDQFSIIDASEASVQAGLVRAAHLRQAILRLAFEGALVPQSPKDEPASKLLERISVSVENKPLPKQGRAKQATAVPKMKKATR